MLPRLRFVIAAALIAALPWLVLGSGIVTTAQNSAISESSRPPSAVTVGAGDFRDAYHMHILAYVRRSRELERLRELANAPLSEWVAAPAGAIGPGSAPEAAKNTAPVKGTEPIPSAEPARNNDAPPAAVAALPAAPEKPATQSTPGKVESAPPSVEKDDAKRQAARDPDIAPSADPEPSAAEATGSIPPGFIPPLPRAKPTAEEQEAAAKRLRARKRYAARPRTIAPTGLFNTAPVSRPAARARPSRNYATPR